MLIYILFWNGLHCSTIITYNNHLMFSVCHQNPENFRTNNSKSHEIPNTHTIVRRVIFSNHKHTGNLTLYIYGCPLVFAYSIQQY